MNRISSFLLGVVVGAAGLFLSENYYIVRSSESVHLVPKVASKLEFPYRDIRAYTIEDWRKEVSLGAAIVKSQNSELMVDSLSDMQSSFEGLLRMLGND